MQTKANSPAEKRGSKPTPTPDVLQLLKANPSSRLGTDPVVMRLLTLGLPVTRVNYLKHMGNQDLSQPMDAEMDAELPEELQAGGPLDV